MKPEAQNETVTTDQNGSRARRVKGNGRDHWMPVDAKDWLNDQCLSMCSLATQGVWIRMLLVMWLNDKRGELIGTIAQLALKIGRSPDEVRPAVTELQETGTADVFVVKQMPSKSSQPEQNVQANEQLIIRNRRMHREYSKSLTTSEKRAEAGRKGGLLAQANFKQNAEARVKQTSSSTSTSPSTSPSSSPGNKVREGMASPGPGNRNGAGLAPAMAEQEEDDAEIPF
jgi:hypothetical protein